MYSGLGVVIAILLAELLCIVFLLLIYRITRAAVRKDRQEGMQSMDSYPDCIRGIWLGRWPMAVMNALLCVPLLVAVTCMCRAHLEEYRNLCYGFFIGKYAVVCGVLIALLVILVLPSIGKTFAFIRREDKRYAKAAFGAGAHISMVHGIFLSVFVTVMGPQLAEIFAKEETELLCKLFQLGGSIILVGVLCRYFGRFLTAAGKWIHMLGAVLVTVVLSSVFLGITMRMYGDIPRLLLGVVGGMYLLALLLGVFAFRLMKMRMDWLRMLVIPAGTGILTGLLAFGLGKVFTPHLGNLMTVFVAFAITFLVYWVLLLLFRNFREQELDVISGGRLIHNLGQILRVF